MHNTDANSILEMAHSPVHLRAERDIKSIYLPDSVANLQEHLSMHVNFASAPQYPSYLP